MGHAARRNPTTQLGHAPARVRDGSGKVLEVGDEVLVLSHKTLMRVAEIKPLLDPGAPPNAMIVVMVCQLQIAVPRDTGIEEVYVLRHQAEIGDKAIPGDKPGEEKASDRDHEDPPA